VVGIRDNSDRETVAEISLKKVSFSNFSKSTYALHYFDSVLFIENNPERNRKKCEPHSKSSGL